MSRATVSYVLNDTAHQSIPEATRLRVREAARRLSYTPSASARSLRRGQSELVLLLMPDWPLGYVVDTLIDGLSRFLIDHGLTLVVHAHPRGARPLASLWQALNPVAVVLLGPLAPPDEAALNAAQVHVVRLMPHATRRRHDVSLPGERVGRLQVDHLAVTGHRRIGFAYPSDDRLTPFADPRLRGVRDTAAELGLDPPLVGRVSLEVDGAAAAIEAWRAAGVSAVCAYNDEVALAILAGLRRRGLSAPDDLAVIGVDDIPAARLMSPTLTTVAIDTTHVVRAVGSMVTRMLTGDGTLRRLDSSSLILQVRESA